MNVETDAVDRREKAPSKLLAGRQVDIDHVKAIAIIFVVLGHIWDPEGPEWSDTLKFFIYNFHMSLFMYLSGFAFFLHFSRKSRTPWSSYVAERANRLLVPLVVLAVIIINIKYLFKYVAPMHRDDFNYLDGYRHIIINTERNPAVDLWYLATLFIFSTITYGILQLRKSFVYTLTGIGLILYCYFAYAAKRGLITDDFYIDRICWFYIFFMMGCLAALHWGVMRKFMRDWWWAAGIGFVAFQYFSQYLPVLWGNGDIFLQDP